MRLLFLVNNADFFISHRLPIGLAARAAGHEVHIAAPEGPGAQRLRAMGFAFHAVPLTRSGASPVQELKSIAAIFRLYRDLRPDIAHHITIKPVLYGSLAARLAGVYAVVNAFSGLGFIFVGRGPRAFIRRTLVDRAYRIILRHPRQVAIFQNLDDQALALRNRWVLPDQAVLIRGAGVDLDVFVALPEPSGPPLVVFPARLLRDKGILEFAQAARLLKAAGTSARFALVGSPDPGNPASVSPEWVESLKGEGILEAWGHREDMQSVLASAHIVCLPSYREGLPKALLEAAACGRAIVTTDVPGCREVIRDGVGGLLVRPQDPDALAAALGRLLGDEPLRRQMGQSNRLVAEAAFGIEGVVRETLKIYDRFAERLAGTRPNTTFGG